MDSSKNSGDSCLETITSVNRQNEIVSHHMRDKGIIIEKAKELRKEAFSDSSSDYEYEMKLHLNKLPKKEK